MNNEYYNLQNIKNIPIADYLHGCGIQPVRKYGSYALYNAPYREDHNASMKVDFAPTSGTISAWAKVAAS